MSIIHTITSTPVLDIELPPLMDDALQLPETDDNSDILVHPEIVDRKIEKYMQLQSASLSDTNVITIIVPNTDQTLQITSSELKDIVLGQLLKYADIEETTVEQTIDTGMMMCASLLKQYSDYKELPDCEFQYVLELLLSRSWVPKSTAKLLAEYVHKQLHSKDEIEWKDVKDIFNFVLDDNTSVLVYLVSYCYTLSVCSPEDSFFNSYPGEYINDLDKFITNGVILTTQLLETNKDWTPIVIRESGQTLLNVMGFVEWFVIAILGLQTGYTGYKLGEKVWKFMHAAVGKCEFGKPLTKKQLKLRAKKLFQ
jgi:hypothetical protein